MSVDATPLRLALFSDTFTPQVNGVARTLERLASAVEERGGAVQVHTVDEQGAVQGALSGLASLAAVFAPPIAAWSFGACIAPNSPVQLPGIAFFEAAATMAIALALAYRCAHPPAVAVRV